MSALIITKKKITAIMVGLSLMTGMGSYIGEAEAELSFIDIDLSDTLNPEDFPFGIECGDPDFVYVTIYEQGLLAKINKDTRIVEQLIDQPDEVVSGGQFFYSITRDPNTGNLYINEEINGELWQFNPSSVSWTRIPIIEEIIHPAVTYPFGYSVRPMVVTVDESSAPGVPPGHSPHGYGFIIEPRSEVKFVNGNVWVALAYNLDFDSFAEFVGLVDISFAGLAKVDPTTLEVTRIAIPDAVTPRGLAVDAVDPTILWITDTLVDKVYRFDTVSETVTQTIELDPGSFPLGIANDGDNVFVALNKDPPGNSEIAQIDKSTLDITIIDTGAPIDEDEGIGTFSVFVNNGLLVWTDLSFHVGIIDLSTGEPILDPDTGLPFFTTITNLNHFGCVPVDGEFWFAGKGSAKVGILPNSKFSGGRPVRATSTGGGGGGLYRGRDFAFGDPNSPRYDGDAPLIEEVLIQKGSIKILAEVTDTVGVKDVTTIIGKMSFSMARNEGNQNWWFRVFTSDDLPVSGGTLLVKIVARDYNNNTSEHTVALDVPFGALSATSIQGSSFVITPLPIIGQQTDQAYSIIASGIKPSDQNISPQITIKNTGTEPLQNIRVMLSPELKGKFLLSDYAIKKIDPNSEFTVMMKLNGRPNVDVMNNPIPYNGKVIISVDNRSPYILEISGEIPNESTSLQSLFMKMITNKAEERYKTFVKPEERISESGYNVKLGSGEDVIRSASDELIITNTSDKPLKNLRIMTSSIADHFIPEQKNIELLPAGSFIKVKLVSKMNNAATRDLQGEVIIAPENGLPVTVPVKIGKQVAEDKNLMYKVSTISGSDSISNTADAIVISNNSEESLDNVRIILPQQLARVFSLSEDSFRSIEPSSEETVYIRQRGTLESSARQILNDYTADIVIVSSDGMKKVIPVSIVWKGITSEHFVVYARDNAEELAKAAQVINFLERSYAETTSIIGGTDTKTVIYMTSSLDELRMLSNALAPSTYVYDEDIGFVWSNSEDVNTLALKEFAYRTIMQNYGTYWVKQKILADNGNWLVDGISTYVTASVAGERGMVKSNLDAFIAEPAAFEWYGAPTPSQSGASYTLFKFLAEKYGQSIVDRTLSHLGSAMISNGKCDTIEQCAILSAVYDTNGWNMNDKRYDLNYTSIVEEWKGYVEEKYTAKMN